MTQVLYLKLISSLSEMIVFVAYSIKTKKLFLPGKEANKHKMVSAKINLHQFVANGANGTEPRVKYSFVILWGHTEAQASEENSQLFIYNQEEIANKHAGRFYRVEDIVQKGMESVV